jgi:hypothetical protein
MNNTNVTKTLGIITIATGKYFEEFIPSLKASVDQYFVFPGYRVQFYCFTDSPKHIAGIINIPIRHFAWPFSTLLRYRWIENNLTQLSSSDFLLYMDADMRVVSTPPTSTFDHEFIAVRHPGYLTNPGAFEIDRQDSCYVAPPLRTHYYQGCFWGGKTTPFTKLIHTLAALVEEDLSLGNIPIWHDESYLNHYLSTQKCESLSTAYAWPEGERAGNHGVKTPYVLHLEKKHQVIRQASQHKLNIQGFLIQSDSQAELEIYKKLYLNAHEKTQRLENRLVQKNIWWAKLREWLAYYRR